MDISSKSNANIEAVVLESVLETNELIKELTEKTKINHMESLEEDVRLLKAEIISIKVKYNEIIEELEHTNNNMKETKGVYWKVMSEMFFILPYIGLMAIPFITPYEDLIISKANDLSVCVKNLIT